MKRKRNPDERLRHRLELQALGIERIFLRNKLNATVEGGHVQSHWTTFRLQLPLATGRERLRSISRELQQALGVPQVQIAEEGGQWQVQVQQPPDARVQLLDLLDALPQLGKGLVALGLTENNRPVLLNLHNWQTGHVLVSGCGAAGKSSLLRTIATGLALTHPQAQLQLVFMSTGNRRVREQAVWQPLAYLPHVLADVMNDVQQMTEGMQYLAGCLQLRRREGFHLPRVVVFIEDLATALEKGRRPFKEALLRLLEDGGRAGIHIVAATAHPQAPTLDALLKNGLPVRISGRLASEGEAWAATGITQSGAEQLLGRGDFVAVVTGTVVRFQAAYISDYDLHLCVDSLHRDRPPAIIAQPWDGRPRLPSGLQNAAGTFYFDGRNVSLAPNE